jgi:hypothetical protein
MSARRDWNGRLRFKLDFTRTLAVDLKSRVNV